MIVGAVLVLFPDASGPNAGDLIIFAIYAIPPLGNYAAQQARKLVSSTTMMFVRSLVASLSFFLIAVMVTPDADFFPASASTWVYLVLNGLFLLGLLLGALVGARLTGGQRQR